MSEEPSKKSLEEILRELERDHQLQENVADIRSTAGSLNLNEKQYRNLIIKGLNRLVETYARKLFGSNVANISACSFLLNYDSLMFPSQFQRFARIRQPNSLPAREKHAKDERLAEYVNLVVDNIFEKVAASFQLHSFAQEKIFYHKGLNTYVRTPLFLVCEDKIERYECRQFKLEVENKWTIESFRYVEDAFLKFVNDERERLGYQRFELSDLRAYLYYLTYLTAIDCETNFSLVRQKEFEQEFDVDPDKLSTIEFHRNVLRNLEIKGINLCVIAVSDELSDHPLGTAMVFYGGQLSENVALKMHELFFEYLNALRKVELERVSSRDTLQFLSHEVGHEAEIVEGLDDIEAIRTSIRSFLTLMHAAAFEAGFDVKEEVRLNDITKRFESLGKIHAGKIHCEIGALHREKYDWREAFILVEAVRNGIRRASSWPDLKVEIRVGLDEKGKLDYECTTQPHSLQDPQKEIEKLNSIQPDVLRQQRGIRWIKRYASELGYQCMWKSNSLGSSNQYQIIFTLKSREN